MTDKFIKALKATDVPHWAKKLFLSIYEDINNSGGGAIGFTDIPTINITGFHNQRIPTEMLETIQNAAGIIVYDNQLPPALFCRGHMSGSDNSLFYNIHSSTQYMRISVNNKTGYLQIEGPLNFQFIQSTQVNGTNID